MEKKNKEERKWTKTKFIIYNSDGLRKTWMDTLGHSRQHKITFPRSENTLKRISSKYT